jgi:hypothetical protein
MSIRRYFSYPELRLIRVCFDFSAAAVFSGFLSLFSPCEGGIAVPVASEQGENRGKKNKKEQERKIQNKLFIPLEIHIFAV